jgi:hypothetical protein
MVMGRSKEIFVNDISHTIVPAGRTPATLWHPSDTHGGGCNDGYQEVVTSGQLWRMAHQAPALERMKWKEVEQKRWMWNEGFELPPSGSRPLQGYGPIGMEAQFMWRNENEGWYKLWIVALCYFPKWMHEIILKWGVFAMISWCAKFLHAYGWERGVILILYLCWGLLFINMDLWNEFRMC